VEGKLAEITRTLSLAGALRGRLISELLKKKKVMAIKRGSIGDAWDHLSSGASDEVKRKRVLEGIRGQTGDQIDGKLHL